MHGGVDIGCSECSRCACKCGSGQRECMGKIGSGFPIINTDHRSVCFSSQDSIVGTDLGIREASHGKREDECAAHLD